MPEIPIQTKDRINKLIQDSVDKRSESEILLCKTGQTISVGSLREDGGIAVSACPRDSKPVAFIIISPT